jgi:arylsulfatase A-like enzyme
MRAIFLVLDTVRRDYLEAYGNDWVHTPNLQRLADRGVAFDNHWVGSLPCMPARRELLTGRYNFPYRPWGPIEPYDDTLTTALRDREVFSHLLTDHQHYFELGGENYHTGFDTWEFFRGQEDDPWVSLVDRVAVPEGQEHLYGGHGGQNLKNRQRQRTEQTFSGPRTAMAAIDWLEANREADDWFLQVELFDPHEPFFTPDEYLALYGDRWDGPLFDWPDYGIVTESPEAVAHMRNCYAGLLTMTDRWVGRIFDKLEQLGLWDDTLIVFTTDHGTMLGEHRYWMKNYMPLYNEIARIPLIVKLPGNARAGERVDTLTQTIDLMPTFLDHFGCPPPPFVQGHSLLEAIEGAAPREDAIFGYFGMAMNITDGSHVYMRNPVREDGGPLHAYTAMPIAGLNRWFSRDLHDRIEMGRFFGHTHRLPLYKIPAQGRVPQALPGEEGYRARHQLFDIVADPGQEHPLDDPEREAHLCERIVEHLKACEAPPEQYLRLGLGHLQGQ